MQSIFAGLSPAAIRTDPFPHIVADDVLPDDLHRRLSADFPPFSVIGWDGEPPDNRRFALPAWRVAEDSRLSAEWRAFAALHSSPAILAELETLLRGHWAPAMLNALGGSLHGHGHGLCGRGEAQPGQVLQDARLEINTPVKIRAGSPRGAHLDTPNRLFSALLYLRHPDDESEGGDLQLYRWRNAPPAQLDVHQFLDHLVEPAALVPYRANRLVLFPQGPNALHGVSPRAATSFTRRYVFITAEIGEDWLLSGDAPCAC